MLRSTALLPFINHLPPKVSQKFSQIEFSLNRPPRVRCISSTNLITQPPQPTSAYLHLPFCRKRCHYCDFPIITLGSSSTPIADADSDDPRISNYINLLIREVQATHRNQNVPHPVLETVFFGGGTPSLVPPRLISRILDLLRSKFGVSDKAEISIEMDPGTFDHERLNELVKLGINRVSLGVQAFQDKLLQTCGRAHGVAEVTEAIGIMLECADLENWSIDLISSLPHQTAEMWAETLQCAINARPKHVSVYDLQVEQGTKFGQLYNPGEFPLPTENQSAEFYKIASQTLSEAGYNHYEISSYAKPGYECKHNLTYWKNEPFYGFGLGSASFVNGYRFSRPRRLKDYESYVEKLENGSFKHDNDKHAPKIEVKEMAMDDVMLSLRTSWGLDLRKFMKLYGKSLTVSLCEALKPFVESGHAIAMDREGRSLDCPSFSLQISEDFSEIDKRSVAYIRLSDPEGFLLSNELISVAFGAISP